MCVRGDRLEPDDDIEFFHYESLFFSSQSSAHAVGYRTSKLPGRRGQQCMASKAHCHDQQQGLLWGSMGATVIRTSGSAGAILWKCEHVRMDFCRCFPRRALRTPKGGEVVPHRARYQRRRGSGRTPRRRPCGAAPTSPPEGVFRHKRRMELDELSGRITGRLGYTRRLGPTP